MTRNKIIILGVVIIGIILGTLYFAAQTLSPRTYNPDPSPLSDIAETPDLVPTVPSPTPPIQPDAPSPLSLAKPTTSIRPATDAERASYTAAAPKLADTALVPKGLADVVAHSYGKNDVAIAERPSALVPTSVWKYNPATRSLIAIIDGERGAMFARSENGAFSLSSRTLADGSLSLIYEKIASKERRPLRFATIPPKCFLENRAVLYCGVPLSIPPRTVMPDDYLKRAFYTDDRLVRIDLEDIRVEEIPTGADAPLDIYEPRRISGKLMFLNRRDGVIYAISLPPEQE